MERSRARAFDEFVAARWRVPVRLARLLVGGERHRAEDLLQESLAKLWFAWPKVADDAPEAYVGVAAPLTAVLAVTFTSGHWTG